MTRLSHLTLINQLQHCGATKVTHACIEYERYEGGSFSIVKFDLYKRGNPRSRDLHVAVEDVVTGFITELSADWDIFTHNVTVADGRNANWVEVNFTFVAFPSRDDSEGQYKCPCCGSTL